jgi:cell division septation protein DedD
MQDHASQMAVIMEMNNLGGGSGSSASAPRIAPSAPRAPKPAVRKPAARLETRPAPKAKPAASKPTRQTPPPADDGWEEF